jgi:hypothetical protein
MKMLRELGLGFSALTGDRVSISLDCPSQKADEKHAGQAG